jgi:hypothetical protein
MSNSTRRGAQPGNLNALKNGFYSRQFRELENTDLGRVSDGLKDEIRMLRVLIRRMFDLASSDDGDLEQMAGCLNALGMASTRLANLLRTDQKLSVDASEFAGNLSQALAETINSLSKPDKRKGTSLNG